MTLKAEELDQFTGSENWYRHQRVLITDGAKYVADEGGAYWLLDEIALAQSYLSFVAAEKFQVWKLRVRPDKSAVLECEDGNNKQVFRKRVRWTDFPMPLITLWFTDNTILLPSEY